MPETSTSVGPPLARAVSAWGRVPVDRDDAGPVVEGGRDAGEQATAAYRDENRVDVLDLVEEFEAQGACPAQTSS